jgi:hypothetical protein
MLILKRECSCKENTIAGLEVLVEEKEWYSILKLNFPTVSAEE